MLEIYNEQVRDLLTKENPKGGLPVRQTPDSAFFVQGLKHIPVGSYLEISKRMEQGSTLYTVFCHIINLISKQQFRVASVFKNNAILTSVFDFCVNLVYVIVCRDMYVCVLVCLFVVSN